jgi:hypothetical protein
MKAIEFKTDISKGDIVIPKRLHSRLAHLKGRKVRVMLLFEEDDEQLLREVEAAQFLSGYADSDAIYDEA